MIATALRPATYLVVFAIWMLNNTGCTTSFAFPTDAGLGDTGLGDATSADGHVSDDCSPDDCECAWRATSLAHVAAAAPGPIPDPSVPFNDPDFGTCIERIAADGVAAGAGRELVQSTPKWIVNRSISTHGLSERASGASQTSSVYDELVRMTSESEYAWFRPAHVDRVEADGVNHFCTYSLTTGQERCLNLSEEASWDPPLEPSLISSTNIRRRNVALGGDSYASVWVAMVVLTDGQAHLAVLRDAMTPVRHALVPATLQEELSHGESLRVVVSPSGAEAFVHTASHVWRFDIDEAPSLHSEGALDPPSVPVTASQAVAGPSLVYTDAQNSIWFTEGTTSTFVGAYANQPCGASASSLCATLTTELAAPPSGRAGWILAAFHQGAEGSGPESLPWAAARLALIPLRTNAPVYTLAWHRAPVRIRTSGWDHSMVSGRSAGDLDEVTWYSAWDGSLNSTMFHALLPPEWWQIDDRH